MFIPDLLARVEATQLDSWQRLTKAHGAGLANVLDERVGKSQDERCTLEVLRRGVELFGLYSFLSQKFDYGNTAKRDSGTARR